MVSRKKSVSQVQVLMSNNHKMYAISIQAEKPCNIKKKKHHAYVMFSYSLAIHTIGEPADQYFAVLDETSYAALITNIPLRET